MRLKKEQIQKISTLLLTALKDHKAITFKTSEEKVLTRIAEIITQDLTAEDKLDEEVRQLMQQYERQIISGQLDRQKVFQMIKKQLVKEKNIVL